jgi:hypothetical protein
MRNGRTVLLYDISVTLNEIKIATVLLLTYSYINQRNTYMAHCLTKEYDEIIERNARSDSTEGILEDSDREL